MQVGETQNFRPLLAVPSNEKKIKILYNLIKTGYYTLP